MAPMIIKSEAKYALTKLLISNFTWKIDGFSYGSSTTFKQHFINDGVFEL